MHCDLLSAPVATVDAELVFFSPVLQLQDSRQFHEWLFSTHLCYAAGRQVRRSLSGVQFHAWTPAWATCGNPHMQDEFGKRDAGQISDKALGSY